MLSNEQLIEYTNLLEENPDYVDQLPDEVVNQLIQYLQIEIANQEQLINQLKEKNEN